VKWKASLNGRTTFSFSIHIECADKWGSETSTLDRERQIGLKFSHHCLGQFSPEFNNWRYLELSTFSFDLQCRVQCQLELSLLYEDGKPMTGMILESCRPSLPILNSEVHTLNCWIPSTMTASLNGLEYWQVPEPGSPSIPISCLLNLTRILASIFSITSICFPLFGTNE